jgi:diketogulonate reductase-like aldo/keto reductase
VINLINQRSFSIQNFVDSNSKKICEVAKKYNKTPSQIVIRWNIQNHRSVIPRSCNEQHLKENLHVFDFQLNDQDMKLISNLNRGQQFLPTTQAQKVEGQRVEETQATRIGAVGSR